MLAENNRAFKEWAVACEALRDGRQTLLIRKGGIREEGGKFTLNDKEFFLLPTYEHQDARLVQLEYAARLQELTAAPPDPNNLTIDAYALVDTIFIAQDEAQVNALSQEHIWNATYVKERFDFNPYDPVYLLLLRVYRLPAPQSIPMRPEYEGCKSWVTLETMLSTEGITPAIPPTEFATRRATLLTEFGIEESI